MGKKLKLEPHIKRQIAKLEKEITQKKLTIELLIPKRAVGRPVDPDKKKTISLALPPDLIEWLDKRADSRAVVLENAAGLLGYKKKPKSFAGWANVDKQNGSKESE